MNSAYIVKSATHFPPRLSSKKIVEQLYSETGVRKLSRRFAAAAGIDERCLSVDPGALPDKNILPHQSPVEWLTALYRKLLTDSNAHFMSLAYNMSSHKNFVPTLSSQLCSRLGISFQAAPPEEFLFMGCASAVFSIAAASRFCHSHPACQAFVASFEQSSWQFNPVTDRASEDFVPSLRGHLLFGDAAAGLLITGEDAARNYQNKALIMDVLTGFRPGDCIGMKNGRFLVGDNVSSVMPSLVSNEIILPLLQRNNLTIKDITEWSIHQGSHQILNAFAGKHNLGLSDSQLEKAHNVFSRFGNVSSPSCLLVLDEWLKESSNSRGKYGIIAGFGAGYYMGAVLYRRC